MIRALSRARLAVALLAVAEQVANLIIRQRLAVVCSQLVLPVRVGVAIVHKQY